MPNFTIRAANHQDIGKIYGMACELADLQGIAVKNNCNRLEWKVTQRNNHAKKFYEKLGARALNELTTYRLQEPALSAFFK